LQFEFALQRRFATEIGSLLLRTEFTQKAGVLAVAGRELLGKVLLAGSSILARLCITLDLAVGQDTFLDWNRQRFNQRS